MASRITGLSGVDPLAMPLERLLSGYVVSVAPALRELQSLVRRVLSRRVHRHYSGFAAQQRLEWEKGGRCSAKKLLYVLRSTLTGTWLLQTGEVAHRAEEARGEG